MESTNESQDLEAQRDELLSQMLEQVGPEMLKLLERPDLRTLDVPRFIVSQSNVGAADAGTE